MRSILQILVLMIIQIAAGDMTVSLNQTCDYVAKSRWRNSNSYEPFIVNITAFGKSERIIKITVPFCLIKDNEQCFPNNDGLLGHDRDNEFDRLYNHMLLVLPEDKNRVESILEDGPYKGSGMARAFRGFSCKSGRCGLDGKCQPCSPSSCIQDDRISLATFIRKKEHHVEWTKLQEEMMLETDCTYIESFRTTKNLGARAHNLYEYEDDLTNALAVVTVATRIEVPKASGEYLISICTLPEGATCFPNTKRELLAFRSYLEQANFLPNPKFLSEGVDFKLDSMVSLTDISHLRLIKSLNCYSGVCNSGTLKCEGKGDRMRTFWKLEDMEGHTINAAPVISSFVSTFIAVIIAFVKY